MSYDRNEYEYDLKFDKKSPWKTFRPSPDDDPAQTTGANIVVELRLFFIPEIILYNALF